MTAASPPPSSSSSSLPAPVPHPVLVVGCEVTAGSIPTVYKSTCDVRASVPHHPSSLLAPLFQWSHPSFHCVIRRHVGVTAWKDFASTFGRFYFAL